METKCAAFWNHTNIRNDNNIFPCCRYKTPVSKFTGNVIEILNTSEYQKLREDSLNNVENPNCQKCYYEESLGKHSLRQQFNEEYSTDEVSLKFLEVGLDNICNLTCDGCWDEFSSSWAKANNSTIIVRSSHDVTELPNSVNKVLFLGGEPLMTTRHLRILRIANRSELDVTYNTNGTFLLDEETIRLLNECKSVKFILSIDGYGSLNEQVRGGSAWSDILAFINQITKLGYKLTIHTVIHKNNWHGLKELSKFVNDVGVEWTTNILTYPKKLEITNVEDTSAFISMIESLNIPNKEYIIEHVKLNNSYMLDYQLYPHSDKIKIIHDVAINALKDLNWREIRTRLSQEKKDTEDTYIWWYSRSSKDNKVFHDSNARSLLEDTEYSSASGHFNVEVTSSPILELASFKDAISDLPGLSYAGAFFIGPDSFVEEHVDKDMYNILINVKVPDNAFLTVNEKQFYFKDEQIIMFDGDFVHSATNNSNKDWVMFVLRINKREFHK